MNSYLAPHLKHIKDMAFAPITNEKAFDWAVRDALKDLGEWYRGNVGDEIFHQALNAFEDLFTDKKMHQIVDGIRLCKFYEGEERALRFRIAARPLVKYIRRCGIDIPDRRSGKSGKARPST